MLHKVLNHVATKSSVCLLAAHGLLDLAGLSKYSPLLPLVELFL